MRTCISLKGIGIVLYKTLRSFSFVSQNTFEIMFISFRTCGRYVISHIVTEMFPSSLWKANLIFIRVFLCPVYTTIQCKHLNINSITIVIQLTINSKVYIHVVLIIHVVKGWAYDLLISHYVNISPS